MSSRSDLFRALLTSCDPSGDDMTLRDANKRGKGDARRVPLGPRAWGLRPGGLRRRDREREDEGRRCLARANKRPLEVRQHSQGPCPSPRLVKAQEGDERMDRTTRPPLTHFVVEDDVALLGAFGIGELVGLEGAEDRMVRLSPRSSLSCPLHRVELRPDACRTCRLLSGENRSDGQ